MTNPHEVMELCAAASELYEQAEEIEAVGTVRTVEAAKALRDQAKAFLLTAEKALKHSQSEAVAEDAIRNVKRIGEDFAREIKYRVDLLVELRASGTLVKLATDNRMPVETFEFYVAVAFKKNFERAVMRRRQVASPLLISKEDIDDNKLEAIRVLAIEGKPAKWIADIVGLTMNQVRGVVMNMTPTEKVQRRVARVARKREVFEKMQRLQQEGCSYQEIAVRTGYTNSYVRARLIMGKPALK